MPDLFRFSVCAGCGHRRIVRADDDQPECPKCRDGLVLTSRVIPLEEARARMFSTVPLHDNHTPNT